MSKNNVVALAKPLLDPEEALRSERSSIVGSVAEAERKLAKLTQAHKDEERIFTEIAELGEKEIEAVKAWVASGCEGAQPQPDAEARRELTERMARAVDATKAAKAVASEVESEAGALRARLAQIDAEIRTLRILAFETQFADAVDEFAALAMKMHRILTTIRSAPIALIDVGRREFDAGNEHFARTCYAAAGRMRETRLPEVEPEEIEILRAVASLTGAIVSGGKVRLDAPIGPTPSLGREAMMAAVAATNQAENKLNIVADAKP